MPCVIRQYSLVMYCSKSCGIWICCCGFHTLFKIVHKEAKMFKFCSKLKLLWLKEDGRYHFWPGWCFGGRAVADLSLFRQISNLAGKMIFLFSFYIFIIGHVFFFLSTYHIDWKLFSHEFAWKLNWQFIIYSSIARLPSRPTVGFFHISA